MTNKPVFTEHFLEDEFAAADNAGFAPWEELAKTCNGKIAPILEENRRLREGLEFYAKRKHIKMDEEAVSDSSINFDPNQPEWRIGKCYIDNVEYGQVASKALEKS